MSDPSEQTFIPWVRRGLSALQSGDWTTGPGGRSQIQVALDVAHLHASAAHPDPSPASVTLAVAGPQDVASLDARAVVRTWPHPDTFDAEPNYFAAIDFIDPDLPWRYTSVPPSPTEPDQLLPWIALIVLSDDEVRATGNYVAPTQARPLAQVTASINSLPPLEQAFAWAHVDVHGYAVSGGTSADGHPVTPREQLADLLGATPHAVVSRLLCPRQLAARTTYRAFLVPAFEKGRLAGLGQAGGTVPPTQLAWITPPTSGLAAAASGSAPAGSGGASTVTLPIYYEWRFGTGVDADFESLARRLAGHPLPDQVGTILMSVRNPGAGLMPASNGPLPMRGALGPSQVAEDLDWPSGDSVGGRFVDQLQTLVNRPADDLFRAGGTSEETLTIVPPLYGRWHAARDRLQPGALPEWFEQLNADPRLRVAAGLGTRIVQNQQQALMASAWRQVGAIRAANEAFRFAQDLLINRSGVGVLAGGPPLHCSQSDWASTTAGGRRAVERG